MLNCATRWKKKLLIGNTIFLVYFFIDDDIQDEDSYKR